MIRSTARSLLLATLVAGLLAACSPTAPAASPASGVALTAAERAWLGTHGPLTVAAFPDYPPFSSLDDAGRPVGFSIEVWELVAERIGATLEIAAVPFPDQIAGVRSGRFDSAAGFLVLPSRTETFAFTTPYYRVTTGIYVRPDDADRTTIPSLAGLTVAVVEDDSSQVTAEAAGLETVVVDSYEESLLAVADGRAGAAIMDLPVADFYNAKNDLAGKVVRAGEPVPAGDVALPVRKDQTVLLGILDKALASIDAAEIDALLAKWVGR